MTQKDKQDRSTQGWMPITPRRASVLTTRHILVLATITTIILAGSLLMNAPATQTTTPPEPTPPTLPVEELSGIAIADLLFSGDLEGAIVVAWDYGYVSIWPCTTTRYDLAWEQDLCPDPASTLTFDFGGSKYRGSHTGNYFKIMCEHNTQRVIFKFRWTERYQGHELYGHGDYVQDGNIVTITLSETIIRRSEDQNAWKTLWKATQPVEFLVTIPSSDTYTKLFQ
jgi:hypothetical protein